ncbi:MAG: ABC transporter permease subunit [Gammaproteobacteria bacterium]
MTAYFIRRFLLIIPTFIGITILVFAVTRMVPGGPIERMLTEAQLASGAQSSLQGGSQGMAGSALSESQLQQLRQYYGFDKPVLTSYLIWLQKVVKLDLGYSTRYGEPVWETIRQRLPVSIYYGIMTMILTYSVCIPLGILKAIKHKTSIDNITSILVFIGYAIPGYVVGIIVITIFAFYLEWFPLSGFVSDNFSELSFFDKAKDLISHSVLPLIAYMSGSFAVMTFMMKNSLMDNLASDYVRTAMAKGLEFKRAVIGHAFRNSIIPIATNFGDNITLFLAGSFLIEKIFNIDGFGLLGYESLIQRDYPVVMGILVIGSLLSLIGNILSDICVALVDPRVRFGS